mgnify:CR=1 FL=1
MGFLRRLFGIGVTAGATVAAVRVADKYKANNPDGVGDVNGDGKTDARDVLSEVAKAAGEVYDDAAAAVKKKAPVYAEKAQAAAKKVEDTVESAFQKK